jgi:glycosyltransferase involved in cell wall biosynthesis
MRVLHVAPSVAPDRGGPARSAPRLVRALREAGVEARLAAAGDPTGEAIPLAHLPVPHEIPTPACLGALREAVAAADLVEVHSLWNGTSTAAAAICRSAGRPCVLAPRGMLDPLCLRSRALLKGLYRRLAEGRTLRGAAGFHFLSEEERDRAVLGNLRGEKPVAVAPNGIDALPAPAAPGTLRRLFPAVGERRVLLHLGRLDPIKGLDLQVLALARIPEAERPALLLVGPDFGERSRLERLAARAGVAPLVLFAGPVFGDERFALLAEADAVLLTSVYDCNPMAANETLSAGGALLATEGCGVAGFAAAGAARVVPRDERALAEGILGMLRDAPGTRALRERARAFAAERLPWAVTVEPLLRLYEDLLRAKSPCQ